MLEFFMMERSCQRGSISLTHSTWIDSLVAEPFPRDSRSVEQDSLVWAEQGPQATSLTNPLPPFNRKRLSSSRTGSPSSESSPDPFEHRCSRSPD
jgi:hypothetical protein